ncbi:MAG: sulfatase [Pirellulaceae bacterium]|nr:sulfatase [Pirellulaceae bacterium]
MLLLADDLGYGETGCQGGRDIPTPRIDQLAAEGVRFTDGYVTAPFCAASRAGLLTGRYQTRFGFEFNPIGARNEQPGVGLPPGESTIAHLLRDGGYATALIGKWHLGGTAPFHPQRRGFDQFYGFLHEGHYFVPPPWEGVTTWLRRKALPDGSRGRWTSGDGRVIWSTHMGHNEPDYDANNPILRNSQPVAESEYLTDALTREAESFIDRHAGQPFFLLLSYNAVHSPLQATDRLLARFNTIGDIQRRIFAAMLAHLDESVGRVLDKLRERNLDRDTLVVLLSDNGGPTRELTSSNRPLRGEKGQLYEGGIRVPFLARWPGQLPAGQVCSRPVSSLDLVPTFLAAARIQPADNPRLDGVELRSLLAAGEDATADDAPRTLFWRVGARHALRHGDWKLVRHGSSGDPPPDWELYDLAGDAGESRDLARQRPDVVRELAERWQELNAQMVEPLWR